MHDPIKISSPELDAVLRQLASRSRHEIADTWHRGYGMRQHFPSWGTQAWGR